MCVDASCKGRFVPEGSPGAFVCSECKSTMSYGVNGGVLITLRQTFSSSQHGPCAGEHTCDEHSALEAKIRLADASLSRVHDLLRMAIDDYDDAEILREAQHVVAAARGNLS